MIDKKLLNTLGTEIDEALKAIGKKHGVTLTTGSARFSDEHATFKLEVCSLSESGDEVTKEAVDFKRLCWKHGLKESDLYREMKGMDGGKYTIMGIKARATRNILSVKGADGKTYTCDLAFLGLKNK